MRMLEIPQPPHRAGHVRTQISRAAQSVLKAACCLGVGVALATPATLAAQAQPVEITPEGEVKVTTTAARCMTTSGAPPSKRGPLGLVATTTADANGASLHGAP
jgi:hypothetical protein